MKKTDRDAQLKLLMLQGALYRLEIVEAKIALCESSKPSATTRRLFSLLSFALEHRQLTLIGAVLPRLLGCVRSSRFTGRMLLIIGSSLIVWWLMRRRSEA
jgi:hypothetical protein